MKRIICQPKEAIAEFVSSAQGTTDWGNFSALGLVDDGTLIAGVIYNHYQKPNIMMHVAAIPGRRWLNRDFLFHAFNYPFNLLECGRVTGLVPKKNKDARRFDEHLGFVLEGCMKRALPNDDMLIYGMLKENCKWISQAYIERLANR